MDTAKARVLVVEDEPAIRDALRAAFDHAGYAVHALPDGDAFEDQVDAFRPDLAVLDVMLPGRDGLELERAAFSSCAPTSRRTHR